MVADDMRERTVVRAEMLTVVQVADRLGLSPATIRSWIVQRRITFARLGRSVRIPTSAIEEIIERGIVRARESQDGKC